jgi:hypothetical protein
MEIDCRNCACAFKGGIAGVTYVIARLGSEHFRSLTEVLA